MNKSDLQKIIVFMWLFEQFLNRYFNTTYYTSAFSQDVTSSSL